MALKMCKVKTMEHSPTCYGTSCSCL